MRHDRCDDDSLATETLTANGRTRRDEILAVAIRAQHHRRIRRRVARGAMAVTPILVIAGVAWFVMSSPAPPPRSHQDERIADVSTPHTAEVTTAITDGPGVIITVSTSIKAQRIDDADLLALLAEAGRPDGLVRIGGVTMLASELARSRDEDSPAPPQGARPSGTTRG